MQNNLPANLRSRAKLYNPNEVAQYIEALKAEERARVGQQMREKYARQAADSSKNSKIGSGNQNPLTAWISELSGAGGAVGGAAAGAAAGSVLPGLGTLIGGIGGGIIGGFAGGFGGRAAENKIRDNEYRVGDALKEGAWSGAFGGIGPAFQGARGAYAAGKAAGYGSKGVWGTMKAGQNVIDDAISAIGKQGGKSAAAKAGMSVMSSGAKTGRFIGQNVDDLANMSLDDLLYAGRKGALKVGDNRRAAQRGISPGVREMTSAQADSYNRVINENTKWFSGIGKEGQMRALENAQKQAVNQYARSAEGAKVFGKANADDVASRFLDKVFADPALRETVKSGTNAGKLQNMYDDLLAFGSKQNKDFIDYTSKILNPRYKDAVAKGTGSGSVEAKLFDAMRKSAQEVIDEKLITRSAFNKNYATLKGATKELGKTITRDSTQSTDMNIGKIISNVLGPANDIGGRVLQQTGKVSKYTTPAIRGALARGFVNGGEPVPQQQDVQGASYEPPAVNINAPGGIFGEENQMGLSQVLGGGMPQQQQGGSMFSAQNAESAIAQILASGGDFGDVKDYLAITSTLGDLQGSAGGANLTANQKNKVSGLQGGLAQLDVLEKLYGNINKSQNQIVAAGGGLPGVKQVRSSVDPKVREYMGFAEGTIAPLIRSLGESGVLTDADREKALNAIPNLGDSESVAANKLASLKQLINDNITRVVSGGDTGMDSQSALAQLISQQYGGL